MLQEQLPHVQPPPGGCFVERCIFCRLPFGHELASSGPLELVVPRGGRERVDTLQGSTHLYCLGFLAD